MVLFAVFPHTVELSHVLLLHFGAAIYIKFIIYSLIEIKTQAPSLKWKEIPHGAVAFPV